MSATLFLIDGHSILYQAYYAVPGLTAPDGRPTGAVYGFVRTLDKILREKTPSHVAVVLDAGGKTFRHKAFPGYKATRKPMPDELRPQVPLVLDVVRARGIPVVEVPGVEADDVIGTLSRQAAEKGFEVFLVSRDKDLKQLLGPRVRIWDAKTDALYGAEDFRADTGLEPGRFPDWIGLAGDAVDDIPGVPGIGEKKALDLLHAFGTLEGVLERRAEVKGPKTRDSLGEHADTARLSRDLAVIRTALELPVAPEALVPGGGDAAKLEELYASLGFRTLLAPAAEPAGGEARRECRAVDRKGLPAFLKALRAAKAFGFDLETTGPDAIGADLVGLSFAWKPGEAWYLPVRAPEGSKVLDEREVLDALRPVLTDAARGKIGHNLKFDATVLRRRGIEVRGIAFDTLIAAYLLNPGRRSLDLKSLAAELLRARTIPITELIGEGKEQTTLDRVDLARVTEYACQDADLALRLRDALAPSLDAEGVRDLFDRVEMPLVGILADMETEGIGLEPSRLEAIDREVEERMADLEKKAYAAAGQTFNLNSTKQLQAILFDQLKLPKGRKTKTGPSTDADVLEELARIHPLPAILSEHRVLKKLQSTYLQALPRCIHPATGRIHGSFNQAVAATGRLSSSQPNLQNIPDRTDLGSRIREAFVPRKGRRFLAADYSQVELRMMAHLSGDEELRKAFRKGEDIHAAVAARIRGLKPSEVTKEMRQAAKAVNFGILYGQTAYGLSRELRIGAQEAATFIEQYFARYSGVKAFVEATIERAHGEGRVRTILGRFRALPDLRAANKQRRAFAEREAVNTVIQGSAADLIKLAMIAADARIRKDGLPAKMVVQIHDELLFEVEASAAEAVAEAVREEMEGAMKLEVPLKADTAIGDNWMQV